MKAILVVSALLLTAACSSSTPVSPSPQPTPAPPAPVTPAAITVTATLTNTVTGAVIGSSVQDVTSLPAQLTIAQAGYVTRQTWVSGTEPRIDLFPEAGFDLGFYRQFLRAGMEGRSEPLRVLRQSPSIYMEVEGVKGLSAATAATLERVARRIIPELTGGRLQLLNWETGPTPRPRQPGWIVVERQDEAGLCGKALVGASAGQIFMDGNSTTCNAGAVFAHELGHALGLWHVDTMGSLMYRQQRSSNLADAPTAIERHHAALAYTRLPGNTDVDSDPRVPSAFQTMMVVD